MMAKQELDWQRIQRRITGLLDRWIEQLPEPSVEFVRHQLAHDEYETALEGLCLAFTLFPESSMAEVNWEECIQLSRLLGLDRESVLDDDFWQKLVTASEAHQ